MNAKRCSFCTRYIGEFHTEMTVEHIELKKENPKKIFCWKNLLCACRTCNTKRSIKRYEASKYMDPTKVQGMERFFKFQADGSIVPAPLLSDEDRERAEYMIDLYELNREDLVCDRRKFYMDLLKKEYYDILYKEKKDS